jgi:hypothetical protein
MVSFPSVCGEIESASNMARVTEVPTPLDMSDRSRSVAFAHVTARNPKPSQDAKRYPAVIRLPKSGTCGMASMKCGDSSRLGCH